MKLRIINFLVTIVVLLSFSFHIKATSAEIEIKGTANDDVLTGTEIADTILSGSGNDSVHALGGNDYISLYFGDDSAYGGDGDDDIRGYHGRDLLYGEAGNDRLEGHVGDDYLDGGNGIDRLLGGSGNDTMIGGAGNDYLSGYNGEDIYIGGSGADLLNSNADNSKDVFIYLDQNDSTDMAKDRIKGFEVGFDKIDLSNLIITDENNEESYAYTGIVNDNAKRGELRVAYSSASNRTYLRDDFSNFELFLDGDYRTSLTNDNIIARTPCSILIAGQSLGRGVYGQRLNIDDQIITAEFKMQTNCSNIGFVNGATGGSAAECAITQESEGQNPSAEPNCWINHNSGYNNGERHGKALSRAKSKIDDTSERIIAIIWSQGETDSTHINKLFSKDILNTENLCVQQGEQVPYCKAAYKANVAEIFEVLRSNIVTHSMTNFELNIAQDEIPIFIPVIGRRAFNSYVSPSSIKNSDTRIQTIREAQYEIVNEGKNIYIAALGYDQPLQEIAENNSNQVHPTDDGYIETGERLLLAIRRYFNYSADINDIPDCIPAYIGPRIVEASWDGADIIATVAHSIQSLMPSTPICTQPSSCGLQVLEDTSPLAIEVIKDGNTSIIDGLKHTRYRILLPPGKQHSSNIALTFAYGAMNEINAPSMVDENSNNAINILTQRCLPTMQTSECISQLETRRLPIQPAFFSSQDGDFVNKLKLESTLCPI